MAYSALSQYREAEFPKGMADVRGFEVRTLDDEKVGKIDDLVFTPDGRLRYLDIDLGGIFNKRHVVLPIGAAKVDRQRDVVWISGMTKDQIKSLPDYTGDVGTITSDYETRVRGVYADRTADADLFDQGRFYADRGGAAAREARLILSEEQLAIGKRQVKAGEVGVRKTVETEHVRETVPVRREEVTVERRPLEAGAVRGDVQIGEEEIRVPLMAEEVVVDKRVVPKEEVVLRKGAVTEERVVEEDLRRERLDESGLRTAGEVKGGAKGAAKGAGKRIADAVDDLKDRVDANPASRPGPDSTDRPERQR